MQATWQSSPVPIISTSCARLRRGMFLESAGRTRGNIIDGEVPMRRIWQKAIVATILTGAACGGEVNGTSSDVDFQETSAAPHPTGEYKTISSEEAGNTSATLTAEAAPPQRIIFFNRNGGTYKRGGEDSRTNSSTIPPGTVTMPAYSRGDAAWTQFMTCMKDEFA